MERMNICGRLEDEFYQLKDAKIIASMKSRKPSDMVALLQITMKRGGIGGNPIRHVPIIESKTQDEPNRGELKALISNLDMASLLTPPWDEIPLEILEQKQIPIAIISEEIKNLSRQSIQVAFSYLFKGETPKLFVNSELRDAMKMLIEPQKFGNKTRRYRTIPIFNEPSKLVGMLSYYNVLEEIKKRNGHQQFLQKTVGKLLEQIEQKIDKIVTLEHDSYLFEASAIFDGVPFTHIPITEGEKSLIIVTGIVDEVKVKTNEHNLFIDAFADRRLNSLQEKVLLGVNTVGKQDSLEIVLERFLKKPERPTALLVGTEKNGKFHMEGIISYVDILKNFKKTFLEEGNNQSDSED
jgi:hypothetical protein